MLLSVIVPCFNEEAVLPETHRQLVGALSRIPECEFEILYVDDGSRDRTPEILRALAAEDPHVRVIRFSRNFGHQMAVTAGAERASGDAVALIDADLQDPPEVIAAMVEQWRRGYQVVYGVRAEREGETRFKLWTASAFYRLINWLSAVEIPLDTGDFRLMDRKVVDALLSMPERDRFIRGMVSWVGFRQIGVPYRRAARHAGETKYPFLKMLRFALDAITSFSLLPLKLATWAGFLASTIALGAMGYGIFVRLFMNSWVPGWAALFTAVLFVGGVQLISLGIIGEYVGRIYGETKRRPLYLVQEQLGFDQSAPSQNGRIPQLAELVIVGAPRR